MFYTYVIVLCNVRMCLCACVRACVKFANFVHITNLNVSIMDFITSEDEMDGTFSTHKEDE
jgi:hypothetical protein